LSKDTIYISGYNLYFDIYVVSYFFPFSCAKSLFPDSRNFRESRG